MPAGRQNNAIIVLLLILNIKNNMQEECKSMMENPKYKKIAKIVLGIIVLLLIIHVCIGGHGYNKNDAQQDTIVVSGKGEVVAKPDLATVSFSVTQEDLDVSKASDAVNTKISSIVSILKADGVNENDIKTTGYTINPRYDYGVQTQLYPNGGGKQTLAGYDVTQSIEVKMDIAKSEKVVTDLGTAGVTNLYGPNFSNKNNDELVKEARDEAIKNAREDAERLAKSLGVRLVKIVSFTEGGNYPIMYGAMMKDSSTGASTPANLPAGENTITSNVSVTYEIR